jgi:creatinine amidohydrolase
MSSVDADVAAPPLPCSNRVMMAEMTWVEYDDKVRLENPIVMIPVGALEQHGPHLPLGTDRMVPEYVSRQVATRVGGIVAPAVSFGYKSQPKSGGGNHFHGTTSLNAVTLISLVHDVIMELARHGVRRIAVFDGHYENAMMATEAIDLALTDLRRDGIMDLRVVKIEYWQFISADTERTLFPDAPPNWALDHAAVMETSVMLHLYPELVRRDLIPDHPPANFPLYEVFPTDISPIPADGVLSSAASATADKGRLTIEQIVPDIAEALRRAFA